MPKLQHKNAYFYNPHQDKPDRPLLVFLPGLDETGKDLMTRQTASLSASFDLRCFVIPPQDLDDWELLAESVLALTEAELDSNVKRSVYLCGESFGGCLALKVLLQAPQLFEKIILVNPASSFHRLLWLNLGSLLFPLTPDFFYNHSAWLTLPFLAPSDRLLPQARQDLANTIKLTPKQTAQQRLAMMREFKIDETKLKQINQATVVTLPHSGHACLVEADINLDRIMQAHNFQPRSV
ncbi:MAG: alpha/beta fold hydrolase [Pleurocapsa sp.]